MDSHVVAFSQNQKHSLIFVPLFIAVFFFVFLFVFSGFASFILRSAGFSSAADELAVQSAQAAINRQKGYEFDLNPDGTPNGGANRSGPNNPVINVSKNTPFSVRIGAQRDGGGGGTLKLEGDLQYDTTSAFTSPVTVTTATSNAFAIVVNSGYANHAATAQELVGVTDGTFVAGQAMDGDNGDTRTGTITIGVGQVTEVQFNIQATVNAVNGQQYFFRVVDAGAALQAYDNFPDVTLVGFPVFNQRNARIENDDGGRGYGGSPLTTPYTARIGERINVRVQVENTGDPVAKAFRLEYDKNLNAVWTPVSTTNEIRPTLSERGENDQVVPVRRAGACGAGVSFEKGRFHEGRASTDALRIGANKCTENVFSVDTVNASTSVKYRFRLFNVTDNAAFNSYTVLPEFTIETTEREVVTKAVQDTAPTSEDDLQYVLDNAGYSNVSVDDLIAEIQDIIIGDTTPDITMQSPDGIPGDSFGASVSNAGDLNGDGWDDIVVGCFFCDAGAVSNAGKAFVYFGDVNMDSTADLTLTAPSPVVEDRFGIYVSGAGDANGDGFQDVVVGCYQCDVSGNNNEGKAFIFFGGDPMNAEADVTLQGPTPAAGDEFGRSVSGAGDVDNDGFDDVIAGARLREIGANSNAGEAYIFLGGSSMDGSSDVTLQAPSLANGDAFGNDVANAGNVNGDNFADVIVGCLGCSTGGQAFIFYGGSTMNGISDKTLTAPAPAGGENFGFTVASAGSVNGDEFDDVIMGCHQCDVGVTSDAGKAFIFFGATDMDTNADKILQAPSPAANEGFGYSVDGAGDTNGDQYTDVIVGCFECDVIGQNAAGKAFLFFGGQSMDTAADRSYQDPSPSATANFGYSVATAGNINGDNAADILIGCRNCDITGNNNEGKAYVYYSGELTDETVDQNADGADDVLNDFFGFSVAAADVNGDRHDDILIGCYQCNNGATSDTGKAYVFYGGLTMDAVADKVLLGPDNSAGDQFGYSIAGGDVNGDTFEDVIVGCNNCDNTGSNEGKAFVFFGGLDMNENVDVVFQDPDATNLDEFGTTVVSGDVNGDGYDDVLVGCPKCDNGGTGQTGKIFIFFGGSAVDSTVDKTLLGPDNTLNDEFGESIALADVNGDGFVDVISGCSLCDNGATAQTGKAYVFYGGSSMDTTVDKILMGPDNKADDRFGISVVGGDVNGDGFRDVVAGCHRCDNGVTNQSGKVYVFHGGQNMDTTADKTLLGPDNFTDDEFGNSVSVGDVNNDGYADVAAGCHLCENGVTDDAGKVFVFYGGVNMDTTVDHTFVDPDDTNNDEFARAIVLSDLNQDGHSDIVGGCHRCNGTAADAGKFFVFAAAKDSGSNMFGVRVKNDNDTDEIRLTWKGQSNVAPSSAAIRLEIFRYGSGAWEQRDSDTITAANTAITLTDTITANLTQYYQGAQHIVKVRAFQDAATSSLQTDLLTVEFGPFGETTTAGDGTDPANASIIPGDASMTELDSITFVSSSGDTVTQITFALGNSSQNGINLVEVTSDDGVTLYGSTSDPGTATVSIGVSIPVATTTTQFKVRIRPKIHSSMPVPPGQTFTATGVMTSFISTNSQGGSDVDSAVVTIDNLSPTDVTATSTTPGNQQITVSWTASASPDVSNYLVLTATSSVTGIPNEGTSPAIDEAIGNATVVHNASTTSFTDTGLTNGTEYFYKIFTKDTSGNYSTPGVEASAIPNITTLLGDGTDPGNVTIGPGDTATSVDAFTLRTDDTSDTVTQATVSLASGTHVGITLVEITSDDGVTVYGSAPDPASETVSIGGMTIPVTSTTTQFKVRITPKTATGMPAVPGALYAVTGTITSFTASSHPTSGSDTDSATVTIDNLSPADVTATSTTPGNQQITVSWTASVSGDVSNYLVLTATSSPPTGVPIEGSSPAIDDVIGNGKVVHNTSATSFTHTGLVNGQEYHYLIYTKDTEGNYSTPGVAASDTPVANPVTAIYRFDARSATEVWATNPEGMVTASTDDFASTKTDGDIELLTGNTASSTDLGAISKVEIRAFAKADGNDEVYLRPVFSAGDGTNHIFVPVAAPGAFSSLFDITNDTNAPAWTWADVDNLGMDVEYNKIGAASLNYISSVEVHVTYQP